MAKALDQLDAPISEAEFAGSMDRLQPGLAPGQRMAVAVSGGPDSMALLVLAQRWAGSQLIALTVDHGLRLESADEALQVAGWCAARGIAHRLLRWRVVPKPDKDIQAVARRARYQLLAAECGRLDIGVLLVAHHQEDQAETFLLRLARGSGVDGLASMADETLWGDLRVLRPLLDFPKRRLAATLLAAGQPWIEDPSNRDQRFARPRMRAAMPLLAEVGLSAGRLAATARRMRRVRAVLDHAVEALLRDAVRLDPAGFARLSGNALARAPEEIGLRALSRVLMTVGAAEYTPRMQCLELLYEWILHGAAGGGRTLLGCRIVPGALGLIVTREPAAMGPELLLRSGEHGRWDDRFAVRLAAAPVAAELVFCVRAVAMDGIQQALRAKTLLPHNAKPRIAYRTTPGLWQGARLLAAPQLGYFDSEQIGLARGFAATFAPPRYLLPTRPC